VPAAKITGVHTKLITAEDFYHVHKFLGVISVLHWLVRVTLTAIYGNDVMVRMVHPVWRSALVCVQVALSLTSLQFHVPRMSSSTKPMIHQLFRAHSIIFAMRGALCSLLLMWCEYASYIYLRSIVVLLTLFAADCATTTLSDPLDKYRTTRAMPYWANISQWRQTLHKVYYVGAQFSATLLCITSNAELLPLSTLVAIQGAALLQTLVRKSIISTYTYHMVYMVQLNIQLALMFATLPMYEFAVLMVLTWVRSIVRLMLDMNKYIMWMLIGCGTILHEHGSDSWPMISAVVACAMYCRVQSPLRNHTETSSLDPNTRVNSITNTSQSHARVQLRTRDRIHNFRPGQYVTISDGNRVRKYTVLTVHEYTATQSLVDLAVRRYFGPTFSEYLCSRCVGDVVVCDGPFGTHYYDASTRTICSPQHVVRLAETIDTVVLFAGGSGIVPMYAVAVALLDANVRVTLVVANTSESTAMLSLECMRLQSRYPLALQLRVHVTETNTRMTRADVLRHASGARVSCVCGPTTFVQFIQADVEPLITW
jgi:ferredoxin-NADP reductase